MSKKRNVIEAIYPLSPMQQGMLFHTLYDVGSGVYVGQMTFTIHGLLDVPAFQRAWQQVIERHPVLRTTFLWEYHDEPFQAVYRQVRLPWQTEDWRDLAPAKQDARLAVFLDEDRRRSFDLAQVPLMRLALFQVAEDTHQLVWSRHHLLLDGWSVPLVLNEVFAYYDAFANGQELHLAHPRPYRDYIAWLQQQDLAQAEAFWRQLLHGFTAPTPLGVDRPLEPDAGTSSYADQDIHIAEPITAALQALSRQHGLTLNTIVQGAWALLLSRYSGELDVVFGATVAGRPPELPGVETMIGLFINTLPVRTQVVQDVPLLTWLQQLQEQQAELRQYEYSPLVQIQGWSEIPRGQPLFESLVVFENYPMNPVVPSEDGRPGLTVSVHSEEQANYPLALIAGLSSTLDLRLAYDRRRFDEETIGRMLGHVATLLGAMAAAPTQHLGALPLLTPDERARLLDAWPRTPAPEPPSACLHELVAAQAARTPDAVALVFAGQQLTYGELDQRATQLAYALRQHGVGPEVPVALLMERSLDQIVALLAVLKAGGAYLPLDPAMPAARLQFVLADAEVPLLLTEQALLPTLPPHTAEVLCLDRDGPALAQAPAVPLPVVGPDTLAYVIYTSGSTGQPKGVQVPQRGIANLAQAQIAAFGVTAASRVLQFAALSFDAALSEVAMALVAGATLVLAARDDLLPGPELLALLRAQAITHVTLPPSVLAALPDAALPALHTIITAGEACPAAVVTRWSQGRRVINAYGPTEATVCATLGLTTADGRDPAIGRPIANGQVYVLDAQLEPVPVGVAGELYLGGIGVARGYLHRPALTADTFIPDPFAAAPGARLYRTGDRGRWRADGQLDFLGRSDQQVKLRGYRIELGEIEAALRQQETVRDAVVLLRHDTPGDPRLVAYVVENGEPRTQNQGVDADGSRFSVLGSTGGEGLPASLRQYLKDRLPPYMLPSAFVVLDALPLTAHGKVDRKALPAPDGDGLARDGLYVAPRTPIEEVLTSIWASVLRLEQIGAHENFFELGGHSLLVTQVIARIRATFQVELPLRSVFESPTIAQLAERIELAQRAVQGLSAPPVQAISRDARLPLSYAQQRLWFLNQLQPESPAYNIATALYLIGPLDVATLQQSLSTIVQRHEALRTTFTTTNDGEPVQVISAAQELPLPLIDLQDLPEDERETAALRLSSEEAQRPFDLHQGPLFRASLVHLDASRHLLLLTMHHIVADGWSMGVFMRELITLYAAGSEGTIPALPELSIQYADYAVWQRDWLSGAVLDVQLAYWRQQLADLAVLQLPTDYPRPVISSFQGAAHVFTLPRSLSDALVTLSRREQATLFMTLLAAWQILLARYSGQHDIVVGTTIAGRTRSEIEDLIGCFINTLVLRTDLSGSSTFRDVLQRVRQVCLGAYAHQDLPFEQVVEELHPSRDLSRQPLFQVLFELQNAPMADIELPDLKLRPLVVEQATAKFDLSLTLGETEEGLVGVLAYATDLFAATTIERIAGHFQALLEGIVANPEQPLTTLPILTAPEWQELVVARNATRSAYPTDICFHQMFEAQVERTPDAVAAVFGAEQLTYRELNARANQLAHYLRKLGVEPEVRVGICVERSFEMLIGLLGIFKAGGAFVPIEPAFPAERMAFILADAQVSVVLTQDRLRERLPAYDATLVALDADWPAIARESVDAPASGVSADNLSYLIYTSGSTGRPKGVLIPHRGLVNYLYWCAEAYTVAHGRGAPVHASIAADAIFPSLFAPLIVGTSVVLIPELQALEGLAEELCAHGRFSMIKITPSQLEVLTQQLPETDMTSSVRTLVIGAEALRGEVLAYWQRYAPQTVLLNEYGPTETVVGCSIYQVEQAIRGAVPIGLPIANTTFYVLDRQLRPVPVGVPGELYIGGDGVAWGYHNRPELTAERFVPDLFSDTPGARLYKTGDLVIYLDDRAGNIEFLGRRDDQVKIRGYRVEPGEIEVVLAQHPGVREVVVLAREDVPGDRRLVAYVVGNKAGALWANEQENKEQRSADASPSPTATEAEARRGVGQGVGGEGLSPSELRSYLHAQLPEYMVPAAFVLLDAIPLAPHGKVDRKALPAPDTSRPDLGAAFVAPQTPAEMVVAQVWADAIGIEQVGIHDNFFQLGGHSLQASRIIVQLRQIFQVQLPLRSLFEQPTVSGLIQELTRLWGGREGVDEIARIFKELEHLSDEEVKAMLSS